MFKFEQFRLRLHAELEDHKNRILRELSGVDKATLKKLRELVNDSYEVKGEILEIKKQIFEMEISMANKIDELRAKVASLNESLTDIEFTVNDELGTINNKIATLNDRLSNLNGAEAVDTTALANEIETLEENVASMQSSTTTSINGVKDKLNTMEGKIDGITEGGESGGSGGSGSGESGSGYTVDFSSYTNSGWEDYYNSNEHRIELLGPNLDSENYSLNANGQGDFETVTGVTSMRLYIDGVNYGTDGALNSCSVTYTMGGTSYTVYARDVMNSSGWTSDITLTGDVKIISVSCHYCLTGDTLITMADGSEKRIDSIVVGDKVLALDPEALDYVEDVVTVADANEKNIADKYDIWLFADGSIVKTVHRHRLYNIEKQAMVYMDEWSIGDHAFDKDGASVELISHDTVIEEVRHYTIFTEKQNYFVNGLLAGNRFTKPMAL